jgi:hypothetical protein
MPSAAANASGFLLVAVMSIFLVTDKDGIAYSRYGACYLDRIILKNE